MEADVLFDSSKMNSGIATYDCKIILKGPIIGIESYTSNSSGDVNGFYCGSDFAVNKCICLNQLLTLTDYALKTIPVSVAGPTVS